MQQPYSELYRLVCEHIEAEASRKLARPLTNEERRGIWDAGSLLMLEVVDRAIVAASTAAEVAYELAESAAAFRQRRKTVLDLAAHHLHTALGRPLTIDERERLRNVDTLYVLETIVEQVKEAAPSRRPALLQTLLARAGV